MRCLLLRIARGVKREEVEVLQARLERLRAAKEDFEGGYEALRLENRQLKTQVKELKLQLANRRRDK